MKSSGASKVVLAVFSMYLGYQVPLPRHGEAANAPQVGLGDGTSIDRRVDKWLDFHAFWGKDTRSALQDVAAQAGLKLDVEWTMVPGGVIDQTFVTHNWAAVCSCGPVEQALDALLPVHNDGNRSWTINDGTLIFPAAKASASLAAATSVRIYDITSTFPRLVAGKDSGGLVPQWYEMHMYNRQITPEEWQGLVKEAVSSYVADLVKQYVAPGKWSFDDNWNGFVRVELAGDIKTGPGFLIIRQTPEGHRQIERFLQLLNGQQ